MRRASAIWSPIVKTGFRLVMGSWKIMEISLPRTLRISSSEAAVKSRSRSEIRESGSMRPGGSMSRRMDRQATVLPQPDSPTMPSVSPGLRVKLTPSTARTIPSAVWKYVRRFSTLSKGALTV